MAKCGYRECGKDYKPNGRQLYCSPDCRMKEQVLRAKEKRKGYKAHEDTCVICGDKYMKRQRQMVCCPKKSCKHERSLQLTRKSNSKKPLAKKTLCKCVICGSEFYKKGSQPKITCSKECSKKRARDRWRKKEYLIEKDIEYKLLGPKWNLDFDPWEVYKTPVANMGHVTQTQLHPLG